MELEELITAAVEKRIADLVEKAMARPKYGAWDEQHEEPTQLERRVERMMDIIAQDEVKKYEPQIRTAIQESISNSVDGFEVTAYSKIKIPKK